MELHNEYLLQGTEGFAKGEFDNVAASEGALSLERMDGRYMLYGCYTSQPLPFVAFDRLMVSWNAETPDGTVVEAQVRVRQAGVYSEWQSFGRWSPQLRRAGVWAPLGQPGVRGAALRLDAPADQLQLRIYLYTNDDRLTPAVRLLAAAVRPIGWQPQEGREVERELYAPAYRAAGRDPAFGESIDLPIAVASLINHWGEDLLPEELAHLMYDEAAGGCENLAFAAAAAGCYGYRAWAAYRSLGGLRAEIRSGHAAAVLFSGAPTPQQAAETGLPLAPGLAAPARQRMLVVRGFTGEGADAKVLVNDPAAPPDATAPDEPARLPLSDFLVGWQEGITLLVHRGEKGEAGCRPARGCCELQPLGPVGRYLPKVQGADWQLPTGAAEQTAQQGAPESAAGAANAAAAAQGSATTAAEPRAAGPACTLAYTLPAAVAHPTTAHKQFRFLTPGPAGEVQLPPEVFSEGGQITVYLVDRQGGLLVGEVGQ